MNARQFFRVTSWARAIRFWIYVALAALAFFGFSSRAHAQACLPTTDASDGASGSSNTFPTRAEAVAACAARASPAGAGPSGSSGWHDRFTAGACTAQPGTKNVRGAWVHQSVWSSCTSGQYSGREASKDKATIGWKYVLEDAVCASKPPLLNKKVSGTSGLCSSGCSYLVDPVVSKYRVVGVGTPAESTYSDKWFPTGTTCVVGTPDPVKPYDPNKSVCVKTGANYSECVKSNGDHCVTASSGKTLCWSPSEEGERITQQGDLAGDRKKAPATPETPPSQENPTPQTTTTTTINGTTYNTLTTTGTGINGQPNPGIGGTGGEPGSGEGDGEGDGDGDCEGDNCEPGDVGSGTGDLYTPSGKTVASVVAAHAARMSASPIVGLAEGFLDAGALGGSCPTWTLQFLGKPIVIDFFCRSEFQQVFVWMGWLVLALFAWAAFRVGVLD